MKGIKIPYICTKRGVAASRVRAELEAARRTSTRCRRGGHWGSGSGSYLTLYHNLVRSRLRTELDAAYEENLDVAMVPSQVSGS